MKEPPNKISKEIRLKPDYVITYLKDFGEAYKIPQRGPCDFFIQRVQVGDLPPQYKLTLRYDGVDKKTGKKSKIYVDIYNPIREFEEKLKELLPPY